MVTIEDVAKLAKVSPSTVSHALSKKRPVKEATRARIFRAMEELGYVPNRSAQALRAGSSRTVGIVITRNVNKYSEPFFAVFTSTLADVLTDNNYDLLLSYSTNEMFEVDRYKALMQASRVDAFIVLNPKLEDRRISFLVNLDIPFVLLGRSEEFPNCPHIDVDNVHGTFIATEHLINMGHTEIGFIGISTDMAHISHPSPRKRRSFHGWS